MKVQVWLHTLNQQQRGRAQQSRLARALLQRAFKARNITLANSELQLPGLALIDALQQKHNLNISIAHCRTLVAIAIADGPVGLDCEAFGQVRKKARNWCAIAGQFFTPKEASAIQIADSPEQCFLKHWTYKEAYIKAIRGSIFGDLNRLVLEENGAISISDDNRPWHTWQGKQNGCVVAVCCCHTDKNMEIELCEKPRDDSQ